MSIDLVNFVFFSIIPLYMVYILTQLFVGIFLFIQFSRTKLSNTIPLAFFFILSAFEGFLDFIEVPDIIIQIIQFIPNTHFIETARVLSKYF